MGEISNKTLALLLVLTIAISLGGTILSLNRLNNMRGVTGYDTLTDTGFVNVSVTSNVAINFSTKNVDFGSGNVMTGCSNCTMNTPSTTDAACCGTLAAPASGFIVENVGNKNASIQLASDKTAVQFLGGTNPGFNISLSENEAGSCINVSTNTGGLNTTWNGTFYTVPTGAGPLVCYGLKPDQTTDTLKIDVKIRVPDNSLTGKQTATLTATATQV